MSTLNRGRRAAEADMRGRCRITRAGDGETWNPDTLQYEPAPRVTVYEGKCKLRRLSALQERTADAAGQRFLEQSVTLALPVIGTGDVGKDQLVEILSDPTDTALVGDKFRVVARVAYANATSRRFTVEETQ